MTTLIPSDYRFIVDEDAEGSPTPGLNIVCEPVSETDASVHEAMALRLRPGTTVDEARQIASLLQRTVGGFCRIERTRKG